ncbi:MAG: response regulator [Planctomycetota bacterium]|nr:response regulator [Planctomycetota bacterium]
MSSPIDSPAILITDDDRAFRETLQSVFAPLGFRTYLAADGVQAVDVVGTQDIHVALLDLQMPRMNGLEALYRIHAQRAALPCILISGAIDALKTLPTEAYSVVSKPVSHKRLREIVFAALHATYSWGSAWTLSTPPSLPDECD